MRRMAKLLSVLPFALVFATGCDNVQNMTSPADQVTAQYVKKDNGPRRLAATLGMNSTVSTQIDAVGGVLEVKSGTTLIARLSVPAGAARNGTNFTMTVLPDFTVELTATSSNGSKNDVGAAGFKKSLYLYLNASYLPTPTQGHWAVAELKTSGALVSVGSFMTTIGGQSFVGGVLRHFSAYVPVEDDGTYVPIQD